MSDENLTPEELPMEDKKKAINLQDLVYVKKYIDESMDKKLEAEIPGMVADEMNEGYYTQAETDATFYKRTDTVANANHATSADNATQAVNANHATTADSATSASTAGMAGNAETANEAAHAINADKATDADHATNADYATNAGHATNATHADTADNATNATNATNAVLKTDGSYAGLVIEEAVMKLNDGTTLYAESAVNATHADRADSATNAVNAVVKADDGSYIGLTIDTEGVLKFNDGTTLYAESAKSSDKSEVATYAESANYTENAGYAENAGEASNAVHANTADLATNTTNAISKSDGSYTGLTLDGNGVLRIGDTIIPQKKLLFESEDGVNVDTAIPFTDEYFNKDLEIHVIDHNTDVSEKDYKYFYYRIRVNDSSATAYHRYEFIQGESYSDNSYDHATIYKIQFEIDRRNKTLTMSEYLHMDKLSASKHRIHKIYEIIE